MKKLVYPILAILIAITLAACSTSTATTTPSASSAAELTETLTPSIAVTEAPVIITFTDPVLEKMVRGAIGKPQGDITAEDAAAVTRLDLGIEWQRYISEDNPIQNLSGLEYFTNLEHLDLSFHAISDIAPLQGLSKLTWLSLRGNPVADITPLGDMTNLQGLLLSNSTAQDYSPLARLASLEFLMLDNSAITDVSSLASLTNLRHLYLANCGVTDYSSLMDIYPNLVIRDFTIASTLQELGFAMNHENHQAYYESDAVSFTINHTAWGAPPWEWDANIIRMSRYLESGYRLSVGFYGDINAYVIQMDLGGELLMNYVYDLAAGNVSIEETERQNYETAVQDAMSVAEGEDVLLAPIRIFNDAVQATFNMTADALYALPFAPPSLLSFGFFPDQANGVWRFEQRGERDVSIDLHRPEWGEKDYDFLFFTTLSEEYRVVITYYSDERKFVVKADDNDMGGADYTYFIDTQEHIDGWVSNADLTVEEYFVNAFNDPAIEDVYQHTIDLMQQYVADTFGLTIDELLALPTGE